MCRHIVNKTRTNGRMTIIGGLICASCPELVDEWSARIHCGRQDIVIFQIVVKSQAGLALLGATDVDTRIDMEPESACVACRNMNGVCESNLCGWGTVCVQQSERELILSRLRLHTAVTFDGGCVRNFNAERRRAPPPSTYDIGISLGTCRKVCHAVAVSQLSRTRVITSRISFTTSAEERPPLVRRCFKPKAFIVHHDVPRDAGCGAVGTSKDTMRT